MKDQVAVSYRVTGRGNAVVEPLFAGTPMEMTTVYDKDGWQVVLTHYCAVRACGAFPLIATLRN